MQSSDITRRNAAKRLFEYIATAESPSANDYLRRVVKQFKDEDIDAVSVVFSANCKNLTTIQNYIEYVVAEHHKAEILERYSSYKLGLSTATDLSEQLAEWVSTPCFESVEINEGLLGTSIETLKSLGVPAIYVRYLMSYYGTTYREVVGTNAFRVLEPRFNLSKTLSKPLVEVIDEILKLGCARFKTNVYEFIELYLDPSTRITCAEFARKVGITKQFISFSLGRALSEVEDIAKVYAFGADFSKRIRVLTESREDTLISLILAPSQSRYPRVVGIDEGEVAELIGAVEELGVRVTRLDEAYREIGEEFNLTRDEFNSLIGMLDKKRYTITENSITRKKQEIFDTLNSLVSEMYGSKGIDINDAEAVEALNTKINALKGYNRTVDGIKVAIRRDLMDLGNGRYASFDDVEYKAAVVPRLMTYIVSNGGKVNYAEMFDDLEFVLKKYGITSAAYLKTVLIVALSHKVKCSRWSCEVREGVE